LVFGAGIQKMNRKLILPLSKSYNPASFFLFALSLIISVLRLNYYNWPPNRDVTLYAVISHELLNGKMLYTDFWDIKPPGIFISYGMAEAVFGYGQLALFSMNLGCALAVLFGVYASGKASGYGRVAGIWAAFFWTALSGDISLQLHDANTEAFMNAFVVWAFVLFMVSDDKPFGYGRAVLIGVLFAWASLYKQVIIFIPLALSLGHIAIPPAGKSRQRAFTHVMIIALMGVIAWGVVMAYMALTGRLGIFLDTMVTHAFAYAGNPSGNVAEAMSSGHFLEGIIRFKIILPLILLASIVVFWGLIKIRSRNWVMISMYAIGAFISIALPGKFYRHYFQIGIPPLIIAGGWATVILNQNKHRLKALMPHLLAAFVLIFMIGNQIPYYISQPDVVLKGKYEEIYLVTQQMGQKLASILKPDETFFQWGAESGLYFFSQRRPEASIHGWSHLNQIFGGTFTMQTMDNLKRSPPDIVILAKYFIHIKPDNQIQQWIYENFIPVNGLSEKEKKYFVLMARRGSPIESRMSIQHDSSEFFQ
jgi:hypothetical protein